MIQLPANYMKRVQVREFPHDQSIAVLYLRFKNDHDQYAGWYQMIEAHHGMSAPSQLEEGLEALKSLVDMNDDPFIDSMSRERRPALDQNWQQVMLDNTINLKEYRLKHGLAQLDPDND